MSVKRDIELYERSCKRVKGLEHDTAEVSSAMLSSGCSCIPFRLFDSSASCEGCQDHLAAIIILFRRFERFAVRAVAFCYRS
jgi:hypothetical protein